MAMGNVLFIADFKHNLGLSATYVINQEKQNVNFSMGGIYTGKETLWSKQRRDSYLVWSSFLFILIDPDT